MNLNFFPGVRSIGHSLLSKFAGDFMYPEGLHNLEQFACNEFHVGYFKISKIFKEVHIQNSEGETLKLPIASLSWEETLYLSILLSVFSEKHSMPSLSGLFQDIPVAFFCLCRFLFRQPFNPNFLQVLIPYSAVIMLVFSNLGLYESVCLCFTVEHVVFCVSCRTVALQ